MSITFPTSVTNTNVSVGTASTAVLAANNSRSVLVLCNDSDANIYLAFGEAAVLQKGILLQSGQSLVWDGGDECVKLSVFAISTGSGKNLTVCEGQQKAGSIS